MGVTEKDLIPTRGDLTNYQDSSIPCTRIEAIYNAYVLYWNGVPCENNHESPRYTKSGHCKACYQMFRSKEIKQTDISKDPLEQKEITKGGPTIKEIIEEKRKARKKKWKEDAQKRKENDPVHSDGGEWYFWNETWDEKVGPYVTEKGARHSYSLYCKYVEDNQ